ncbi:response regulator [Candidatus Obscuribacterales bacterium]|nr:response regulator [Candidatus Obscuribacterales bacterium]MBX3135046.1 response regulator [Candidatus Obscuribacterales bacterium]MBX3150862.1 response regulator [Candidatus Obscuribacterales bacterium]
MAGSSDLLGAIGKVIRKRREAMGISQTELAERAGLHRTYINNIEGGSKNISIDSLKGIADALNTNISELMLSAEATDDAKPPIKVMLVEDSEPDVFLFKQSLAKITALPTTVEVYEDGKKAQEKIDKLKEASSDELPDIIFLDLNLRGGRSGYDLLIDIKSNDVLRHIPVIILTTSSNPQDVRKTYGHFANSFMTKPVDPQEYQSQVANVLDLFTKNMGD